MVKQVAASVVPLKLDAEKEGKDVAKKYGVNGYPTILFVDGAGEVWGRIGGYLPPKDYSTELTKIVSMHKEMPAIESKLKADPKNAEANCKMAWALAVRQKQKEAEGYLAKAAGYKGPYLSRACNMIGDTYQGEGKFDKAIEYFKRADSSTTDVGDRSYALVSIMVCYQQSGKMAEAKQAAQDLANMKGATPEFVDMAKQLLKGG